MALIFLAVDLLAFTSIYIFLDSILSTQSKNVFGIVYFLQYSSVFILILLFIGGYSTKILWSVTNNFKHIIILTAAMPFIFSLFLIQSNLVNIGNANFLNLLYATFFFIFSFRLIALFLIRYLKIFADKILILGDKTNLNLYTKYKYLDVHQIIGTTSYEEDPYFLNKISKEIKHVDRVILDFKSTKESDRFANIVSATSNNIEIIRQLSRLPISSIDNFDEFQTVKLKTYGSDFIEIQTKRVIDIFIVIVASPLWIPIIFISAILIKIDSPGPVFFKQKRIGLRNEFFYIYKFRSMFDDQTDHNGSKLTERNDPRITTFGKFLRNSSLDELPQLFNVLRCEMSLVGPRPSTLEAKAGGKNYWDKFPDYWRRHMILPGMTGLAQIRGLRGNTFTQDDLLKRYKADIEYLESKSLLLDFKILILTFTTLFSKDSF